MKTMKFAEVLHSIIQNEARKLGIKGQDYDFAPESKEGKLVINIATEAKKYLKDQKRKAKNYKLNCVGPEPKAEPKAAEPEEETIGAFKDRVGIDGKLWAEEFNRTAVSLGYSPMDDGWLISWFCNAILAGYDEARNRFERGKPL